MFVLCDMYSFSRSVLSFRPFIPLTFRSACCPFAWRLSARPGFTQRWSAACPLEHYSHYLLMMCLPRSNFIYYHRINSMETDSARNYTLSPLLESVYVLSQSPPSVNLFKSGKCRWTKSTHCSRAPISAETALSVVRQWLVPRPSLQFLAVTLVANQFPTWLRAGRFGRRKARLVTADCTMGFI